MPKLDQIDPMKPNISEFSYGFALTNEFVEWYPECKAAGAPEFPSLYAEGRTGGGYDVRIPGLALFLQFKLSEVLERPNALEADLMGLPYFRMRLRPKRHSKQHELLLELEGSDRLVFYAAPEFSEPGQLDGAYSENEVVARSAFFRPGDIGELPDDRFHYVVFTDRSLEAYFCSEKPARVARTGADDVLKLARRIAERAGAAVSSRVDTTGARDEFYLRLIESMLEIYSRIEKGVEKAAAVAATMGRERRDLAAQAQRLSQNLFGCQLVVA